MNNVRVYKKDAEFEAQINEVSNETALRLRAEFSDPLMQVKDLIKLAYGIKVTDASQKEEIEKATDEAKKIKKLRIAVEKRRKELKEDSLRTGQAIDSVARYIKGLIEPAEQHLIEQRDFVKIQEEKKLDEREQDRIAMLTKLGIDANEYSVRSMNNKEFDLLYSGIKKEIDDYNAEQKRIEQERIEREKREAEEREQLRIENERLRKENEEREAKLKAEREAYKAKLRKENEERERLENEKKERERLEREKYEAEEKARRDAELAPDKEKLITLAKTIVTIEMPKVNNEKAQNVINNVVELLKKVEEYINENVEKL